MRSIFFITIFLVFCVSCKDVNDVDHSLSVREYKEMGVPDPDRAWNYEDYLAAWTVFAQLKWEKPNSLPRKESKKSGPLFHRMIDLDNLSFLNADSLTIHDKAYQMTGFLKMYEDWIDVYTNLGSDKQYYHRELVAIHIFGLGVTQKMLDLADFIMKSDNPADVLIRSGAQSIREIYISYLVNILAFQHSSSDFLQKDLETLADTIASSIQRNRYWMDGNATNSLQQSIQSVMESISSDQIKHNYQKLIEIL